MLTKEISEVEKGMERLEGIHKHWSDEVETFEDYTLSLDLLGMKLSTLKSAQAKIEWFIRELKERTTCIGCSKEYSNAFDTFNMIIDELSSKQEEEC